MKPHLSNAELARRLVEIRNRAISNGLTLLSLDEINAEVNELRGKKNSGDSCPIAQEWTVGIPVRGIEPPDELREGEMP